MGRGGGAYVGEKSVWGCTCWQKVAGVGVLGTGGLRMHVGEEVMCGCICWATCNFHKGMPRLCPDFHHTHAANPHIIYSFPAPGRLLVARSSESRQQNMEQCYPMFLLISTETM